MRNRMYGGVRGRKTKVGRKLLRFPPTRFIVNGYFLGPFLPFMRQILRGKKSVSQKYGSCRIHFRQKSKNLLERGKNRHNFAMSKVKNDPARQK